MANITYLLGAGASANAVPIVSQIPMRLTVFKNYLKDLNSTNVLGYIEAIEQLIKKLRFTTIDGHVKTLTQNKFNKNEKEVNQVKAIVCGLFMFEQLSKKNNNFRLRENHPTDTAPQLDSSTIESIQETLDPRYVNFFNRILDNYKISEKIKIISWNYDLQIELGLEKIIGHNYSELNEVSNIFPHPTSKWSMRNSRLFYSQYSSPFPQIVKMNGTAGIFIDAENSFKVYHNSNEYFEDHLDLVLNLYKEASTRIEKYLPLLKFAWEQDDYNKIVKDYASQILNGTSVLVVIGYSFPDFNKYVDIDIFKNAHNIREVYFQVMKTDENLFRLNLRGVNKELESKAQFIGNPESFYIPHQFYNNSFF